MALMWGDIKWLQGRSTPYFNRVTLLRKQKKWSYLHYSKTWSSLKPTKLRFKDDYLGRYIG